MIFSLWNLICVADYREKRNSLLRVYSTIIVAVFLLPFVAVRFNTSIHLAELSIRCTTALSLGLPPHGPMSVELYWLACIQMCAFYEYTCGTNFRGTSSFFKDFLQFFFSFPFHANNEVINLCKTSWKQFLSSVFNIYFFACVVANIWYRVHLLPKIFRRTSLKVIL